MQIDTTSAEALKALLNATAQVTPLTIKAANIMDPHLVAVPAGHNVQDISAAIRSAAEVFRPLRRKGTARVTTLQSLIDWTNRFKDSGSVLFADKGDLANGQMPTMTAVINYHEGTGERGDVEGTHQRGTAHGDHRGLYAFPLSKPWKDWLEIAGKPLDKDTFGTFIENNALHIADPSPALLKAKEDQTNADWENRLIRTAAHLDGRWAPVHTLLEMSKRLAIYEVADLDVTSNRDTGERSISFKSEMRDAKGAPLKVPNLFLIVIPVFDGGAPYRIPVRLQFRKAGETVRFFLTPHEPDRAFEDAFTEAADTAAKGTGLPIFFGKPES